MKIIYTRHAEEKLQRLDIKKFKITKRVINNALKTVDFTSTTKYGELVVMTMLDPDHILRIIYVIINSYSKIITFYVTRKGRYET